MKQEVVYARVSNDDQAERGFSLESQVDATFAYASEHDFDVIEKVTHSFTGSTLERPGLDKVSELIEAKKVDPVIVFSPGTLTRNLVLSLYLREVWRKLGIELHYCNGGKSEDTPEGARNNELGLKKRKIPSGIGLMNLCAMTIPWIWILIVSLNSERMIWSQNARECYLLSLLSQPLRAALNGWPNNLPRLRMMLLPVLIRHSLSTREVYTRHSWRREKDWMANLTASKLTEADHKAIQAAAEDIRIQMADPAFDQKRALLDMLDLRVESVLKEGIRGIECTCGLRLISEGKRIPTWMNLSNLGGKSSSTMMI